MRTSSHHPVRSPACALLLLAACATAPVPDAIPRAAPAVKPPLRARDWRSWTQEERQRAFAEWDTFHDVRLVPRGSRVHPLPVGAPFTAFAPGSAGAAQLDRRIAEQKVAGIVVLHDGRIRLERYALGHTPAGRWTSQSIAKSMTSVLVGAAMKDGYIKSLDDAVTTYITEMHGSAYDDVTVRQLMTMTSGVSWTEDYEDAASDVARFFVVPFDAQLGRTVSYMRALPRAAPAGTKWAYSTGETHLLGELVAHATRKPLSAYLSEKIWSAYGMEQDATWTTDSAGRELAGCCLQAGLRDYARFGQLVLDGARVDGAPIVPVGWLEDATRKQVDIARPGRGYGYQWWTRDDGTFDAIGIYGQRIHIDRARRLVVAINSAWPVATGRAQSEAQAELLGALAAAVDAERR